MIIMYLPLIIVIIYSFNASKQTMIWGGFSIDWYKSLIKNNDLIEALKNSIILAILSSICAAIIGTLGAVGMERITNKSKGVIEYSSTLPIMIPEIILGMVFMVFFSLLGLPFGMTTLVIAHTTFCIPYVFMLVKARLVGMDKSIYEAAKDLGASEHKIFFDITVPLIFPAVVSGMLLAFAMSLDDVVISIFVTGPKTTTLPVKVYTQLKTGVTPEINALCTLMLVTTFCLIVLSNIIGKKKKEKEGEKR